MHIDISKARSQRIGAYAVAGLCLGLTLVSGCSSGKATANAFVTIQQGASSVGTGSTYSIFAGANPVGVTWSLSGGAVCSGSACGTLTNATSTSVTYVTPLAISGSSMNVTVTATSTTNSSVNASVVLTVIPVIVTIVGPANPTVNPGASASYTASVSNDTAKGGVTWSLSGPSCSGSTCGTLSGVSTAGVTYIAPGNNFAQTVTLTATSVDSPAESSSVVITVPALTAFGFSPTILPAAIAGQPYSATIQVTGGVEPYTFSPSNLPSWVTATPSGTNTGTLITFSGTPPAGQQGTYYTQITVTDASGSIGNDYAAVTTYPAAATGNSLLAGSYAFYGTGWVDGATVASTLQGIAYVGSFTADGNGNITGGEMDVNSPTAGLLSYTSLAGTYNVQSGQTGIVTLIPSGKPPILPITLALSLGGLNTSNIATTGSFVEFDDSTGIGTTVTPNSSGIRVTGPLALQAGVLNSGVNPFSGSYAFGMSGNTGVSLTTLTCYGAHTCGPISLAGAITFGAGGAISSGVEDVTVAENNASAVGLTGSLKNAGNTDASGRLTGSLTAAANASLIAWPSDYVIYAVDPQTFYIMSSDSYATNSLVTGKAMQQNLTDIAATPFSGTEPLVLYGNVSSSTTFSTKGPNGQIRSELMLLTVVPSSSTAGTLSGAQFTNASGTNTVGAIGATTYSVASATGRVTMSSTSVPELYLVDTSQGFGTQYNTASTTAPGLFVFQPQTSTTLNAGNYTYAVANPTSQVGPFETGIVTLPSTLTSGNSVAVTGYGYVSSSSAGDEPGSTDGILYNGSTSGTLVETNGIFAANGIVLGAQIEGCGTGGGYVISSTSFACTPLGASFDQIHIFHQ